MTVEYNPRARKGEQYSVTLENGETYRRISRYAAEGALAKYGGLSLTGVKEALAEARLKGTATVL